MGHEHTHEHGHCHGHSHGGNKKTLAISLAIILLYMLVEVVGGLLTKSLALLADAGHMLSDAISLGVALIAFTLSHRLANYGKTYGYKRFEVLAAVLNGATLMVIAGCIVYEAIERFTHPAEVASTGMLIISFVGLLVNVLVAWIMMRGGDVEDNLNMRGAYLHVLSDMLGSVGAIVAALCIIFFGWEWADPLASIIVAILVLRSGYMVTKASVHVLMEGTPSDVEISQVEASILAHPEVLALHDLHVWTITSGLNALTCHAVVRDSLSVGESSSILRDLEHALLHQGIHHITIQLESAEHDHDVSVLCRAEAVAGSSCHHHHHH